MNNVVGKNIKHFRKKQGISQEGMAAKLYVTRQTVSNWETGKAFPRYRYAQTHSDDPGYRCEPHHLRCHREKTRANHQDGVRMAGTLHPGYLLLPVSLRNDHLRPSLRENDWGRRCRDLSVPPLPRTDPPCNDNGPLHLHRSGRDQATRRA